MSGTWKRWQDWLTVVVGVLLFITPFVFGATATAAIAWTAYIGGALLVIAGVWSLSSGTSQWIEWAEVVIGVLLIIAPWVLGFSSWSSMAWSVWIAGVLALALGGSDILRERNRAALVGQH
jgi:VIT1/CCC1 family predicted Fe2+/Mn2+ transporter